MPAVLRRALLLATALLLPLAGCSRDPVRLHFGPDGPPLNAIFSLEVEVGPSWVEGIEIDADMPGHNHGMITKPEVVPLGDGRYRVDGMMLHMPGAWEIYVDLVAGERRERQVLPLQLEPY